MTSIEVACSRIVLENWILGDTDWLMDIVHLFHWKPFHRNSYGINTSIELDISSKSYIISIHYSPNRVICAGLTAAIQQHMMSRIHCGIWLKPNCTKRAKNHFEIQSLSFSTHRQKIGPLNRIRAQ